MGGNNKSIALPPHYAGFEHLLLDIDETGSPEWSLTCYMVMANRSSAAGRMEIDALAFKGAPDQATRTLLGI